MEDGRRRERRTTGLPDEKAVADDQRAKVRRNGTGRRTRDAPETGACANDERAEACSSCLGGGEQAPHSTLPVRKVRSRTRQSAPYRGDQRVGRQLGPARAEGAI